MTEDPTLALIAALGREKVIVDPDRIREASGDMTEVPAGRASAIVRPESVDDIRTLLGIAREAPFPLVPMVANSNLGGLAVPDQGGVVVDLSGMNRIIEVNERDLYMVIEPGVTWQDVKDRLDRDHPSVRFGYSLALPHSSVLLNCLMDGLTTLSLKHGPTGDWINGLEIVLADGQVVRTGAAAMGGTWCSDAPAPDLSGLFISCHGTTGIVTKGAIQIFRQVAHASRAFILTYDLAEAFRLIQRLIGEDICDDIGGLSWPIAKMVFGEARPTYRDPEEPLFFIYTEISAPRQRTYDAKMATLQDVIDEERERGSRLVGPLDVEDILMFEPRFERFARFPTLLDFLLEKGGLTWIGTYGPTSRYVEGARKGMDVMERRGFPPLLVIRPMRGGHFGVLRFVTAFDKGDPVEVKAVRELNAELSDVCLDLGFVTYKTPPWVLRRHRDRIDPGFLDLLGRVRSVLDPRGILNPGKWPA